MDNLGLKPPYAELLEQTQGLEIQRTLGQLTGSFHKKRIKGRWYWYFAYRDLDGRMRFVHVGPDGERLTDLIARFRSDRRVSMKGFARAGS